MSRFLLRRSTNENKSFCHVVNFLTACELMSLEESIPLFNAFHLRGEDVSVDIPDRLYVSFKEAMDAVGFQWEEI